MGKYYAMDELIVEVGHIALERLKHISAWREIDKAPDVEVGHIALERLKQLFVLRGSGPLWKWK